MMSYGVDFDSSAETEYYSWGLPLPVYEAVERLLEGELSMEPTRFLRRVGSSLAPLQYTCRVVEQGIPPTVHIFLFRVRYSQDEETLIIWDCAHFPLRA